MSNVLQAEAFEAIVKRRRSVRKFDEAVTVPDEVIRKSLELAVLSPNSSNMQLWEFIWVRSAGMRERIAPLCMGQNAARTADHMVVFITRGDLWKERAAWNLAQGSTNDDGQSKRAKLMKRYYGYLMPLLYRQDPFGFFTLVRKATSFFTGLSRPFMRLGGRGDQRVILHKSCALAAQTFMLSVTAEGFDSCPMEGFDRLRVKKVLQLPRGAEICMIVAVGKGTPAGIYGERKRVGIEEVLRTI